LSVKAAGGHERLARVRRSLNVLGGGEVVEGVEVWRDD
jgi:hypothetical protein